jgi:hypothetical protein
MCPLAALKQLIRCCLGESCFPVNLRISGGFSRNRPLC